MNLLKPGYVPEGWTRGENLFVQPSRKGALGFVGQRPKLTIGQNAAELFFIEFRYEDAKEVQEWLDWWKDV